MKKLMGALVLTLTLIPAIAGAVSMFWVNCCVWEGEPGCCLMVLWEIILGM